MTADSASSTLLELDGLVVSRRHGRSRFQLSVDRLILLPGRPTLIRGRSGSGKSTLMDVLGLVLRPENVGRFLFRAAGEPIDVGALLERRDDQALTMLRRQYLGYMPQTGGLLPYLSVADNILLPARLADVEKPGYLDQLSGALGISRLLQMSPNQLSMGERQRVSLARALAHRPRMILADEPTASLDPVSGTAVMELLLDYAPSQGTTPIVATHDDQLLKHGVAQMLRVEVDESGGDGDTVASRVVSE